MTTQPDVTRGGAGGFTPGPWHGCRDCTCPCGVIWDGTGEIHLATAFDETALGMDAFASDVGVSRAERIANARLITAAPELFEILERFVAHARVGSGNKPVTRSARVNCSAGIYHDARAALAKARGAS